jgi:hypothetical protein
VLSIFSSRRRIKDRHIDWKEHYGERSTSLKKKFEKIMPGSYFRWQGFDHESGHPYYVVVGPAISERHGKAFFAGVKKMPRDPRKKAYSPSGKYFASVRSALSHAAEMWGISFPKNAGHWKKHDLANIDIPRHMKG